MNKIKVFIDGSEGTTGLRLYDRLKERDDLALLSIDPNLRKDDTERKRLIWESDITFLCLPDDAARQAVALAEGSNTRIIDTSTAHRTHTGWAYGLPEISSEQRRQIAASGRVANPGCHATGFILSAQPLLKKGLADTDFPFTCQSLTGFSGGGKKMIADYSKAPLPAGYESPRPYGLTLTHKHLPEMQVACGLSSPPVFMPVLANIYAGMITTVPLHNRLLNGTPAAKDIHALFCAYYSGSSIVRVMPFNGGGLEPMGFLNTSSLAGKDRFEFYICGNEKQTAIHAVFDNLGKGASGAAVQNMNLMLGLPEETGLDI